MEDKRIVELFWRHDETAVEQTAAKYGRYLHRIAFQILNNAEDAEECVNDTYHDAWNAIPPHRPDNLAAFLGKLARRNAVDLYRKNRAEKRGGSEFALVLDELEEVVAGTAGVEDEAAYHELREKLNSFLRQLPQTERQIFLRRYWSLEPVSSLASQYGFSQSKINSMLHRTRKKLRKLLKKEGY